LTRFIAMYFDTAVGPKQASASYTRIAEAAGSDPAAILFVSDVVRELDAARTAGMRTRLALRPGNPPQPPHTHQAIRTFDEI
jgi:enolase-phosphatase E1